MVVSLNAHRENCGRLGWLELSRGLRLPNDLHGIGIYQPFCDLTLMPIISGNWSLRDIQQTDLSDIKAGLLQGTCANYLVAAATSSAASHPAPLPPTPFNFAAATATDCYCYCDDDDDDDDDYHHNYLNISKVFTQEPSLSRAPYETPL